MRLRRDRTLTKTCCLLLASLATAAILLLCRYNQQVTSPLSLLSAARHAQIEASVGEVDDSGKYIVHTFIVEGDRWVHLAGCPATIATHCSVEHLHWLVHTARTWTGPVSVALFTPGTDFQYAICYIAYLGKCHPYVKDKVSVHVVSPVQRPAQLLDEECFMQHIDCSRDAFTVLQEILDQRNRSNNIIQELIYPQNILRNVARRTSPTPYVLTIDVDMVFPSEELALQLEDFLRRQDNCKLCAFVMPVYEVSSDVTSCPRNKDELMVKVKTKQARRYHIQVFPQNQLSSKLDRWEALPQEHSVRVAYVVNYNFWYEPIYVSRRSVPVYDERFVGYGNTRNTQVYEMFLAGWTFHVLNNVFLVHWGFQTTASYPKWRRQQQAKNSYLFHGFLREMVVRYDKDPLLMLKKFPRKNALFEVQRVKNTFKGKKPPLIKDKQ